VQARQHEVQYCRAASKTQRGWLCILLDVVPYPSAGQPFDPARHEAVDVIQTDQAPSGVVLDELSHGYRWGDEVLRPARVRVA